MSTPDDVQRAARNLVKLDKAAVIDVGKIYDALIEDGWTPPGVSVDGRTADALQAAHDAGYAEAQTEAQFHIEQAYLRGQRDADGPCTLTHATPGLDAVTTSPEDWTPVPLRWRHVRPGDVVLGDTTPWMVDAIAQGEPGWLVCVTHGGDQQSTRIDPDEVVSVLCPATEANALARVRDELGGTVVDRTV